MPTAEPKKRGRPVTKGGRDPFIGIRLPEALTKRVEAWAAKNKISSRSAAIRELIERGLKAR